MKIVISEYALFMYAAALLILPLNWLCGAALAALFHELCHFAAVYIFGGDIRRVRITGGGVVMEPGPMSPIRQLICTLAGPIGSLSLIFLGKWFPRIAVCGFVQGAFNLLPLLPLDGGHILKSMLLFLLPPPKAKSVFTFIQTGVLVLIFILLVILTVRFGIFLLIPGFFLLQRVLFGGTIGKIKNKRYGYDRIDETNPAHCAEACPVYRR